MADKCGRCSARATCKVVTSFGEEDVCRVCSSALVMDGQAQSIIRPFGKAWSVKAEWKADNKVYGYLTHTNGQTFSTNDTAFTVAEGTLDPKVVGRCQMLVHELQNVPLRRILGHRW